MKNSVWISIAVMAAVSYLIRVLPITLIRKQITNRFIKSVLHYLPYVTLSVMTVPAIFAVSENPLCGIVAFVCAVIVAWLSSNLFLSALVSCVAIFIVSYFNIVLF